MLHFTIQNHLSESGLWSAVCVCVSAYSCEQTVLRQFSFLTNLRLWALCHILGLPTRPPAAHQEEEIRTIPSCHCSATRAHGEREGSGRERRAQRRWSLFTMAIFFFYKIKRQSYGLRYKLSKRETNTLALVLKVLGGGAERRKQTLNKRSGRRMG